MWLIDKCVPVRSDSSSSPTELFLHKHKLFALGCWSLFVILLPALGLSLLVLRVFYVFTCDYIWNISVKHQFIKINPKYLLKFNWLPCWITAECHLVYTLIKNILIECLMWFWYLEFQMLMLNVAFSHFSVNKIQDGCSDTTCLYTYIYIYICYNG